VQEGLHVTSRSQLSLDFEPGLTARFRTLEDVCLHVVITSHHRLEGVAAHLDMSPSELTRRLNAHTLAKEGDVSNRPLRVCDLFGIIEKTENAMPIHWLAERFLGDPDARKSSAMQQLGMLAPLIAALVADAGGEIPKVRARR
jgi:hypothetical protein